jgi:farnesyl-diphosphate farnesyltransferase
MPKESWRRLLKEVSRSFHLTLEVLPSAVRDQIGIAYLLARATDTIADTQLVSVSLRRAALHQMRAAIDAVSESRTASEPDFGELSEAQEAPAGQGSAAERRLLETAGEILEKFGSFSDRDRRHIRNLLEVITRGQESDLIRFGSASADRIQALETDNDLEEYTYAVAGCVGEFWTHMCRTHLFPDAELDDTLLLTLGIRYGKGLQLVNILRDLPKDLRQGRCYLPKTRLAQLDLTPESLLDPDRMSRFRPLYLQYLENAQELLDAGWNYTNMLPQNQMRVRLACAWPVLIGIKTLAKLNGGNVLDAEHRIKVQRAEIRRIILNSLICYWNQKSWNRLMERSVLPPNR